MIELISSIFGGVLSAISQSWILQGLIALWFLLGLFNQDRRTKLIDNIAFFLRMPLTYEESDKSVEGSKNKQPFYDKENPPIYPRRWFEDAYRGLKGRLVQPMSTLADKLQQGLQAPIQQQNWDSILGGILLVIFIYADLVGGINIISLVPGMITWSVPDFLREYSITVLAGTIVSVIVSSWMISSLFGKKPPIKDVEKDVEALETENANNPSKKSVWQNFKSWWQKIVWERVISQVIAILLLISSFITIIGINLLKLPAFIDLTDDVKAGIELTSGIFLHVVVMLNAMMSTYLLDQKGRNGLKLLALLVLFPLYIIINFIRYMSDLLTSLGPITIDILIRIIFVTLNIIAFYVVSPIDLGIDLFKKRSQ